MNRKSTPSALTDDPLQRIEHDLSDASLDADKLSQARGGFLQLADSAREAGQRDVTSGAMLLAGLMEIATCCGDEAIGNEAIAFARSTIGKLRAALQGEAEDTALLEEAIREGHDTWGEYLELTSASGPPGSMTEVWKETAHAQPSPPVEDEEHLCDRDDSADQGAGEDAQSGDSPQQVLESPKEQDEAEGTAGGAGEADSTTKAAQAEQQRGAPSEQPAINPPDLTVPEQPIAKSKSAAAIEAMPADDSQAPPAAPSLSDLLPDLDQAGEWDAEDPAGFDAADEWSLDLATDIATQPAETEQEAWTTPVDIGAIVSNLETVDAGACEGSRADSRPSDDRAFIAPATAVAGSEARGHNSTVISTAAQINAIPDDVTLPAVPEPDQINIDDEMLSAYLDDAGKCLASMEECLLAYEDDTGNRDILRQFCRELHTLKGASGSVGLANLAHYLHELEDYVEACCSVDEPVENVVGLDNQRDENYVEACCNRSMTIDIETLLKGIDAVHTQVRILTGKAPELPAPSPAATCETTRAEVNTPATACEAPPVPMAHDTAAARSDEFVRVEAARLDRLMDLLAGLVMLRNRRETGVAQLKQIHAELGRYVGRLRALEERAASMARSSRAAQANALTKPISAEQEMIDGYRTNSMVEMCSDMSELGRSLREVFDPLAEDNLAVSRLIGQFRQELMELRRLPVAGLMRRLHRGARDAARAEGKQIHVTFEGENAGLERAIQERLYEPLLHVVRNAVSHGIESPQQRLSAGKPTVGTLTLRAHSDASSLVFEVHDDGRGLDYEAVERRGRELGLLPSGQQVTRVQLAKLIFYPGFSTRQVVSEISGRGVGMDVVTQVVDRMRGQVDVDSIPGAGTTVRLRIPLSSGIEHAMVVQVNGQLFGLPMQHVHGANSSHLQRAAVQGSTPVSGAANGTVRHREQEILPRCRLRDLLGMQQADPTNQEQVLIVGFKRSARGMSAESSETERRVALAVDAVVGTEEVVVRALPPLLRSHRLFSGVTLAGDGEAVLLLDVVRLLQHEDQPERSEIQADGGNVRSRAQRRILVVDDSLSTRRSIGNMLTRAGLAVTEAADGLEAMDALRDDTFAAVLTDLEMPRLGGFELLAEIKRRRHTRTLPVIVITSRADSATQVRARELGADGFITKPVSANALAEIMATLEQQLVADANGTGTGSASTAPHCHATC